MTARAKLKEVAVSPEPTFPEDEPPQILFKPLEYGCRDAEKYVDGGRALLLAKYANAVANGTALLMQIHERDGFEISIRNPQPLFGEHDLDSLNKLVWAASAMLADEACNLIDYAETKLKENQEGTA